MMPKYQLRRPSPIMIVPRQAAPSSTGAPSPDSPDSPKVSGAPESPDSPGDSPSPTGVFFSEKKKEEAKSTKVESSKISSSTAQDTTTSQAVASTTAVPSSTVAPPPSPSKATSAPIAQITQAPSSQITQAPTSTQAPASTKSNVALADTDDSSRSKATPTLVPSSTLSVAPAKQTETGEDPDDAAGSNLTLPEKQAQHSARTMSIGAEAALITFSVIGFLALIIGAIIMIKRRKRKTQMNLRHNPDSFDPSNTGSLHAPETVHIPDGGATSHFSNSTRTESLYAAGAYERPETVSTNTDSRIPPPQPTPNPFADPSLNKAYDVLRGRPRSTTLTDRGSWVENPFKDPVSERFDPFGELKEKARMERVRYMQEVRREQEMAEKERMGLGPPPRKGSGVTVEGVGILDRSGR